MSVLREVIPEKERPRPHRRAIILRLRADYCCCAELLVERTRKALVSVNQAPLGLHRCTAQPVAHLVRAQLIHPFFPPIFLAPLQGQRPGGCGGGDKVHAIRTWNSWGESPPELPAKRRVSIYTIRDSELVVGQRPRKAGEPPCCLMCSFGSPDHRHTSIKPSLCHSQASSRGTYHKRAGINIAQQLTTSWLAQRHGGHPQSKAQL